MMTPVCPKAKLVKMHIYARAHSHTHANTLSHAKHIFIGMRTCAQTSAQFALCYKSLFFFFCFLFFLRAVLLFCTHTFKASCCSTAQKPVTSELLKLRWPVSLNANHPSYTHMHEHTQLPVPGPLSFHCLPQYWMAEGGDRKKAMWEESSFERPDRESGLSRGKALSHSRGTVLPLCAYDKPGQCCDTVHPLLVRGTAGYEPNDINHCKLSLVHGVVSSMQMCSFSTWATATNTNRRGYTWFNIQNAYRV